MTDSYDPFYFDPLFAIEDRHFWFRTRNKIISEVTTRIEKSLVPPYQVLEVGCGTGNVLRVLHNNFPRGRIVGMDLFVGGLRYARKRTLALLIQADMHTPPFATQFDLIGLFDVLEHLSDDLQVLRDLYAMLKPSGALLLTVPAYMSLWSYFDHGSCHYRRYAPNELERKLLDTGYRLEYLSPYMMSLFPFMWLGRRLTAWVNRWRDASAKTNDKTNDAQLRGMMTQDLKIIPIVNDFIYHLLSQETHLITRRLSLPFGSSLLAIARKDVAA